MSTPVATARTAIIGNPPNPAKQPDPAGVVQAFDEMWTAFTGVQSGALMRASKATLDALLAADVGQMAWVLGDATAANNGVYENTGTATAAIWTRRGDLPSGVISLSNVGAGSANVIVATSSFPPPVAAGQALFIVNITATNTASTVTMAVNGAAAKPVKTMSGNEPAIGSLVPGQFHLLSDDGTNWRLMSDITSAAIQAAAEAAQASAEAAAASVEVHFLPVRVAATANIAIATGLASGQTVDGVTLVTADNVLLVGQTNPAENGVYAVPASGAASRLVTFNTYADFPGAYFSVQEGTANADTLWRCVSDKGGTIDVTSLAISEFKNVTFDSVANVADKPALLALDVGKATTAIIPGRAGGDFSWDATDLSATITGGPIASSAVNSTTETITSAAHGLYTGAAIIVTAAVNGLLTNTIYYAIFVDLNNYKIASSYANAVAGTAFNLTGTAATTVKRHYDPLQAIYICHAADISGSSGAWVRQFENSISVDWYGAVPDNSTDCTSAFQFAANYAKDTGGQTITLSVGIYKTTSTVVLYPHTIVAGKGKRVSHIYYVPALGGTNCLQFGENPSNALNYGMGGSDFRIVLVTGASNGIALFGACRGSFINVDVESYTIANGCSGFLIDGTNSSAFFNEFMNCAAHHVYIGFHFVGTGTSYCTQQTIINCPVFGDKASGEIGGYGFLFETTNGVGTTIAASNIENFTNGLVLNGNVDDCTFIGLRFEANTNDIVAGATANNNTFMGSNQPLAISDTGTNTYIGMGPAGGGSNTMRVTLPTSSAGLPAGSFWNNAGVVNVV